MSTLYAEMASTVLQRCNGSRQVEDSLAAEDSKVASTSSKLLMSGSKVQVNKGETAAGLGCALVLQMRGGTEMAM